MSTSDLKFNSGLPVVVPGPHVFCCIALEGITRRLHGAPTDYGDYYSVFNQNPFTNLSQEWEKDLGAITMGHLNKSRLVILRVVPKNHSDSKIIQLTVEYFLYAILMQGFPSNTGGVVLMGEGKGRDYKIISGGPLVPYRRSEKVLPFDINQKTLMEATKIASGMRSVLSQFRGFERIRRGLNAWLRAAKEHHSQEKLHNFVRSLDGFVLLARGEGKSQFIARSSQLINSSQDTTELFGELYDLRSKTEHLEYWQDALPHVPELERANHALLRAFQAERMASRCYAHFFANPVLRPNFLNSKAHTAFWALPPEKLSKIWGSKIDVDIEIDAHFKGIPQII